MRVTERTLQDTIVDIICDCCGKSAKPFFTPPDANSYDVFLEYSELKANWGYGSDRDGCKLDKQFCEKCTMEILAFVDFLKNRDNNKSCECQNCKKQEFLATDKSLMNKWKDIKFPYSIHSVDCLCQKCINEKKERQINAEANADLIQHLWSRNLDE